jgi:acetoin utilization protein AcuC
MGGALENRAIFIHSDELDQGGYPEECPFDSRRAGRTLETARSLGLLALPNTSLVAPSPPPAEVLEWFHTPAYLDVLRRAGRGEHDFKALKMGLGTPDCPLFKDMYEYLSLAVGGSLTGAEAILDGTARAAFNPSGGFHHAGPESAAGFCYLNDVVLACLRLANAGRRVLVVDIDAHHSDLVQQAFYTRSDVVTVSMHESGKTLFPGTGFVDEMGEGEGKGASINIPLPVGTYDAIYATAFHEVVLPVAEMVNPDIIVLEIGMDGLAVDPLAHLNLTNNCYADIIADIVELDKPVLAVGGGGYNAEATVRGWALAWSVLAGGRDDAFPLNAGLGGVMLENTAWFGGLRDRTLLSHGGFREAVDREVDETIRKIKETVFPFVR